LFNVYITITLQLAMLIVWFVLQRKKWSTWRWPMEGPKHVVERSYVSTS